MVSIETGLLDRKSQPIKIGDTVRLILEDGEVRDLKVAFKTVKRRVFSHPDFDDETATVYITGIVFEWNGYDLFPCVGDDGTSDTSRMEIIKV